jgi:tripartite-type tricarboxylate transporter receptor subunit TctC
MSVRPTRRAVIHAIGAGAMLAAMPRFAVRPAHALDYPVRPVRVIVPFAPGGITDVLGRLLAQQWSERLGKQFYVENVPGAGSNIGVARAAQAAPDGYTVLVTDGTSLVVNPNLYTKAPFEPFKEFVPISLAAITTQVLTVTPSLPVHTVGELVALVKANPGQYGYASPGVGTSGHLAGELLRISAGLDLIHVPFGGAGPAIVSTVGGHTLIAFGSPASTVPQIMDGKLRALAVASRSRLPVLPDLPTMAEAGYPEVECDVWVGPLVPTGTPAEIVALLNRETNAIVTQPGMPERLTMLGFQPLPSTSEEALARMKAESAKWVKLIASANLKVE